MKTLKEKLNESVNSTLNEQYSINQAYKDVKSSKKDFPYLKKLYDVDETEAGEGFFIDTKYGQQIHVLVIEGTSTITVGYEDDVEMYTGISDKDELIEAIVNVASRIEEEYS